MIMGCTANGKVKEIIIGMLREWMGKWIWMLHVILSGVTLLTKCVKILSPLKEFFFCLATSPSVSFMLATKELNNHANL